MCESKKKQRQHEERHAERVTGEKKPKKTFCSRTSEVPLESQQKKKYAFFHFNLSSDKGRETNEQQRGDSDAKHVSGSTAPCQQKRTKRTGGKKERRRQSEVCVQVGNCMCACESDLLAYTGRMARTCAATHSSKTPKLGRFENTETSHQHPHVQTCAYVSSVSSRATWRRRNWPKTPAAPHLARPPPPLPPPPPRRCLSCTYAQRLQSRAGTSC